MLARSSVLKSAVLGSVAGLPLARILADPGLARAAADDLETVTITDELGQQVIAALAVVWPLTSCSGKSPRQPIRPVLKCKPWSPVGQRHPRLVDRLAAPGPAG